MTVRYAFKLVVVLLVWAAINPVYAQTWPNKPIKIIVSSAGGGAPDILARLTGDRLSRALGQQMIVDNKPGGDNVIGAQAAARSAPDGYTFFFATAAALSSNPNTFKSLPYDPERDFQAVGMIGINEFVLLVHPSLPVNSLTELMSYDRLHPGSINIATDGTRSYAGLLAQYLNKILGTSMTLVPYARMPEGIQDAVAGRTQATLIAIPVAAPRMKSGDLRAIAQTGEKRISAYPEIPTVAETVSCAACKNFFYPGWFALVAPTGTPAAIIRRMNQELDKVLKDPEIQKRFREFAVNSDGAGTPDTTTAFIRTQRAAWALLAKEIQLVAE